MNIQVEMHIVDHCNLNCNCCNHFSPLAEPWFIELEDFRNQLFNIKNNINLTRFLILGGEPTLHPQLFEICQIARDILGKSVIIDIFSNGINVNQIKKYENNYKELNIHFIFTPYYNKTNLKEIKNLNKDIYSIHYNRILSKELIINKNGNENSYENFFNCKNYKIPCFTVKNNKLYICPCSAHIEHFCKKEHFKIIEQENIDFLYLSNIKNNSELLLNFINTPKTYCKYCNQKNSFIRPFAYFNNNDYNFNIFELYQKNYNEYEKIINGGKDNILWAQSSENPGVIDIKYYKHYLDTEILRYGKGKIDIIIPYYNETLEQFQALKENLLQQSIIDDCVIYLISDGGFMDKGVINLFKKSNLHCIFLRNINNLGPGATRNKGIENSYNNYILFMDADDLFTNNKALEILYKKINNNYLAIEFNAFTPDSKNGKPVNLINRNILQKIQYKNFYFGEDNEFRIRLYSTIPEENFYFFFNDNNIFMEYNTTSWGNNLTSTFYLDDNLLFSQIVTLFIGFYEIFSQSSNIENINLIKNKLNNYFIILNEQIKTDNNFQKILLFFITSTLSKYNNELNNNNNFLLLINKTPINLQNNSFIKNYLINYIKLNYLSNKRIKECAKTFLNILESEIN